MKNINKKLSYIAVSTLLSGSVVAYAAEEKKETAEAGSGKHVEVISIFGQRNQLETATGSAFVVNKEQLEQFEFDDIHRVLQAVPGVYIREEDGYGLRPNIGLRGATTERSSKVAIMEDGILIAPAPYAAPAAYYFPLMSRMTQVEVFKGPSAIKYGPNTVGGAINMLSRTITSTAGSKEGQFDLAYGGNNYQKAHGFYTQRANLKEFGEAGILVEALTVRADGFKEIDNGGDTGFKKNEVLVKANFVPKQSDYYQEWQVKWGYSEEVSHETYLGLTDSDFADNAYRRYSASANDIMDWEHYQFQVSHFIELDGDISLYTQAYRRDFDRDWDRLNSFNTNRSLQTILSSPDTGLNAQFIDVLTGQRDSLTQQETLLFTLNDRKYYSQGIESKLFWDTQFSGAALALDAGLRLHQDQVERNHSQDSYLMESQQLVLSGELREVITLNKDRSTAIAAYVNANLDFGQFNLTTGVRIEHIEGEAFDQLTGEQSDSTETVVLPGIGIFYKLSEGLGLLAGVNKGYVPNSPGQNSDIDPEESWNYEFGFRYNQDSLNAEMIGFYNDYSNLKGNCTFSSGCNEQLDQEFNGGEVEIYGLEASFSYGFELNSAVSVPVNVAYTHTQAEFKNSFNSTFSQWGNVVSGDPLPYLPENQISVEVALEHEQWRAALLFKHVDEMFEAAGSSTELSGFITEDLQQVDFSAWYQINQSLKTYLKVDNITDETTIVSRRPFGARPGKPRQAVIGIKYSF